MLSSSNKLILEMNANQWFEKIAEFFNKYYQLFIVIGTILLLVLFLFLIVRTSNSVAKMRLSRNINSKKYIPSVYVEMGDTADKLRFFSYKKMRKKANLKLNRFLCDDLGKSIKKYVGIRFYHTFDIFFDSKIKKIKELENKKIKDGNNLLENIIFSSRSYFFTEMVNDLVFKHNLYKKNILLLKGNAGTGKTNLISNFTHNLFKNKRHVVYINAKDVHGDFSDYFYNSFYKSHSFKNLKKVAITINLFFKWIFNCKLFVVIEGINENEEDRFTSDLFDFVIKHNFRCFKYVISTREEHFSYVLKTKIDEFFDEKTKTKLEYVDLIPPIHGELDTEYAFIKYSDYYKFTGIATDNTKRIISRNFFLIRLFFEVYHNSSETINITNIHTLFDAYLMQIRKNIPNMDLLLKELCKHMVDNCKFDYVLMSDLCLTLDRKTIMDAVSENILLNLYVGYSEENPLSHNEECISFLFDEFRDYLLTKYIIENTTNPIDYLNTMITNDYSCSEGVARFLYMLYRNNTDKLRQIFAIKGISRVNEIAKNGVRGSYLHFITNYLLDTNEVPNLFEFKLLDGRYLYYENAKAILNKALKDMDKDDSLLISIVNYICKNKSGYFFREFEAINDKTILERVSIILIRKGYDNNDFLEYLDERILDCEREKEHRFDSYDGRCFKIINKHYILFFKKKQISLKEFLLPYKITEGSYLHSKICQMYQLLYGCSWSLKKEYLNFYKKEFKNFSDYLVSINKIPHDLVQKCIKYDGHIKYLYSYNSNSMSALFRIVEIENILEKVCKQHYEN